MSISFKPAGPCRLATVSIFFSVLLLTALTLAGCSGDSAPLQVADQTDAMGQQPATDSAVANDGVVPTGNQSTSSGTDPGANDNTGSGAVNNDDESALVSSPEAAAITDVVLVTGQSNALGADTSYDSSLDVPHPRAFAFTEEGWRVADLNQVWDLGWQPRNDPDTDPSNNFGFHFARKVAQRKPDRVIGFVLVTAPGAGIDHWDYESEFYVKIRNKVVTALNELPSKATIDGILWHQGETDWADNDYYTSKLNDLIRNFRGESWFGDNRPFVCGETVEAPVNNRLMALNADDDEWTGCVSADGVPTFLDGLHFSADGLRIIGTRYATKYIQMTDRQ